MGGCASIVIEIVFFVLVIGSIRLPRRERECSGQVLFANIGLSASQRVHHIVAVLLLCTDFYQKSTCAILKTSHPVSFGSYGLC